LRNIKTVTAARTEAEAIVKNFLAPRSVGMTVQDLNEISCSGVYADGSSHGSLKLVPVVIQYFLFS
jgi:hypothetical protein